MHRFPLLLPAAVFIVSIIAEAYSLGASIGVGIALGCFRRDLGIACVAGVLVGMLHGHPAIVTTETPTARYSGVVVGDVRTEEGLRQFPFAVDDIGTLRATSHERVAAGERLIVRGRVEPIDEARNPGEPSPRAIALDDGLIGELSVQKIILRGGIARGDVRAWAAIARESLSVLVRSTLPEPQATVLAGALWGERGTLPQAIRDDFQATGTVHVLVTAGLHLGIIAVLVGSIFALCRLPRVIASLATIPCVLSYAWLSGWHLPSQRAAAMIASALVARACGARAVSLNSIALAAIVVATLSPVAVTSISFALSFSCVIAIALFATSFAERLAALHVPAVLCEPIALTLSTQIGVWPLTAAVFFTVAPYAAVANAIVVPLVGIAMSAGIAAVLTHPIGAMSAVFARWDLWLLTIVLNTTHAIAGLPGARAMMTPPPFWAIAAYDGAAIGAAVIVRRRPVLAAFMLVAACAGVVFAASLRPPGGFSITALDVGQGDGIVIRTPHGRTILIDTGGRLERGPTIDGRSPAERSAERIVLPYLQRAGITSIDLLLLTHPHGDHVGGAPAILRTMPVGWVADSGQRYGGHAYNDALTAAQMHHVPVIVPVCHQRWIQDEVALTFLSPCGPPFVDGANDVNENSLVVLVQYGTLRALFMGDAGFQSEERLLAQGIDLHADILKVGHHGSAYSSSVTFIAAVRPRFAIVSVGRHNLFGHPAPTTLETLRRSGALIYRTDQCGAVTIAVGVAATPTIETMASCSSTPNSQKLRD